MLLREIANGIGGCFNERDEIARTLKARRRLQWEPRAARTEESPSMSQDEHSFGRNSRAGFPSEGADDPLLPERIRSLAAHERFAVLATQGEGRPYASLIAFALSDDLSAAVFATPRDTRKYRLLVGCNSVALLVDTRSRGETDMMKIEALTATGTAACLEPGPEWERWAGIFIRRHPHLESFVRSPGTALFRVDIDRYFHVGRFQEVRRWRPARRA